MLHHCPIPPHSILALLFGLLAPRQEEVPGAYLIEAFSVFLKP